MENANPSSALGSFLRNHLTQRRNNFEEELFKDRFPTEKELAYHKELLGEPQPPFSTLEPKIKRGDPWSLKIPCVIGTVYTGHAYIDLQSPVNIMSRAYYNKIREKSFQARRNPYQPYKFCNFVGRAKNVHIFIGCFVYVVDFMILEDLGSIIDSGLSEVVLGQPFAHTSKLTYDESLGLIRFAQRDDEVVFRMPQRTKELDLVSSLEKDKFEAFFVENLKTDQTDDNQGDIRRLRIGQVSWTYDASITFPTTSGFLSKNFDIISHEVQLASIDFLTQDIDIDMVAVALDSGSPNNISGTYRV
ncbi:protein kinase-like domain, concanavalin A-like lectin/glucanase domain protein [Tanacetum coccineum]